ncbi:Dabb family protein [Metabacillus arenae]|uniref:Dabb family protein n=1 Tax=Metabacillus arenae TaxID=2771434 RepID=A0A926NHM6_9BACI|nr:Dabb family protein [Metabacillus arenae]MBD1381789.1 Dabb family protein [Metabacillus arenae]
MVEHFVTFKFNHQTTDEQKNLAIEKLRTLKNEISGIVDLHCNHNFSDRNKGYEIGLSVRLNDKQALKHYGPHPKHQEAVAFLMEIGLEDLLVIDFEI